MLLTRAPLYRGLLPFSLDLHVLGAPLTFVLSQDQTLQLKFPSALAGFGTGLLELSRCEERLKPLARLSSQRSARFAPPEEETLESDSRTGQAWVPDSTRDWLPGVATSTRRPMLLARTSQFSRIEPMVTQDSRSTFDVRLTKASAGYRVEAFRSTGGAL